MRRIPVWEPLHTESISFGIRMWIVQSTDINNPDDACTDDYWSLELLSLHMYSRAHTKVYQ